jgi:hypothetical protein
MNRFSVKTSQTLTETGISEIWNSTLVFIGLNLTYITQKLWSETFILSLKAIAQRSKNGVISCVIKQRRKNFIVQGFDIRNTLIAKL